jgi:tRNA uridine 5-carbamoylmethylation protein Kti12
MRVPEGSGSDQHGGHGMSELVVTRGLPGCGKTTYARSWVAADREHRARVNRDDIRRMLDDGEFVKGITEPRVLAARDALIVALLRRGLDVICDDTNLPQRAVRDLARLAAHARAGFFVIDLTDVPWAECVKRDAARSDKQPVGGPVIRDMHERFLKGRGYPLPMPEAPESKPAM